MFSRGRVCVEDIKTGEEIPDDPFLKAISRPNFSQSQQDFLYSHEFFKGTGNNITRVIASKPNDIDKVYSFENLIPSQIDYNKINEFDDFIFAKSDLRDVNKRHIVYKMNDKPHDVPLSELMFFYDVTNGLQPKNRFRSPSRIDMLREPLQNIREAQKAKNINLRLSAKHIISSGVTSAGEMTDGLQPGEKEDIERRFMDKDIHASESNLSVNSLANNMSKLMFDESCASDLTKIATAYGINRDVLSWHLNGSSTYDNKNMGLLDWIQNSIEFEGEDWAGTFNNYFNYIDQGKKIKLKYDHLPVMQIIKEQQSESLKKKAETAKLLMDLGMTGKEAMTMAGLNIDINGK